MTTSTSICIDQTLYGQARNETGREHRTVARQIEYWAMEGRAALSNPELPMSLIAESLATLTEQRDEATDFIHRQCGRS